MEPPINKEQAAAMWAEGLTDCEGHPLIPSDPVDWEPKISKKRLFYPTVKWNDASPPPTPEQAARLKELQAQADDIAKRITVYEAAAELDKRSEGCIIPEKKPD